MLTDPAARAAVADLGRRTGHVPAGPGAGRALDFEKERALRALGTAGRPGAADALAAAAAAAVTGQLARAAAGQPRAAAGALHHGDRRVGQVFLARTVNVRLQVDRLRDRHRRPDPLLGRVDARRQVRRGQLGGHPDLARYQQRLRSDVRRPQVDEAVLLGTAFHRDDDPRRHLLRGRFADEQALRLVPDDEGGAGEQQADADRPDPVPLLVPRQLGQQDAEEGEEQPEQGRAVLEEHDRQLGDLGQVDELPPVAPAPHLVRLADPGAQREALQDGRQGKHD